MDIGNKDNKNYINNNKKFDFLGSCLQRVATTKWFLYTAMYDRDKRTGKIFMNCMKDYLNVFAKCTNLGIQLIHWLCLHSSLPLLNWQNR